MKSLTYAITDPASIGVLLAALLLPLATNTRAHVPNCGWLVPASQCPDTFDPPPCPGDAGGGNDTTLSCGTCGIAQPGMAHYWISEPYCSLRIEDTPLIYTPALGAPVQFHLSYRQRGAILEDPSVFGVGTNWSCSFRACLADLTATTNGWLRLHRGGAGLIDYITNVAQFRDGSILTGSGGTYQIEYPNGAKDTFAKAYTNPDGQTFYFLTAQADPAG